MNKQILERRLEALWLIIRKPLTVDRETRREALIEYNRTNIDYAIGHGKDYVPREQRPR